MKPGSGTLVINIMSDGKAETYEGIYQCTARNERGAAISNNIVVRPSSKGDFSTKRDLWRIETASCCAYLENIQTYVSKIIHKEV